MYRARIILLGESNAGKTTLMNRLISGKFRENEQPTIGVDFGTKKTQEDMMLSIFDLAGQERFRTVTRAYYRHTAAAVLVCDISKLESLEKLEYWVAQAREHSGDVPFYLAINKIDLLPTEREVKAEHVNEFISTHKVLRYYYVSARTGCAVEDLFTRIGQDLLARAERGEQFEGLKRTESVYLQKEPAQSQSQCC